MTTCAKGGEFSKQQLNTSEKSTVNIVVVHGELQDIRTCTCGYASFEVKDLDIRHDLTKILCIFCHILSERQPRSLLMIRSQGELSGIHIMMRNVESPIIENNRC
jgi:hypothetical protein